MRSLLERGVNYLLTGVLRITSYYMVKGDFEINHNETSTEPV